jgi:hypothetical protein
MKRSLYLVLLITGCQFSVKGFKVSPDDMSGAVDDLAKPPDLSQPDLTPKAPDLLLPFGPSSDVAENVLATWGVGESSSNTPVPCNPMNLGFVTLAADITNVHTGTEAVRVSYTNVNYFQAVYPMGGALWDLSRRTGLDVFIQAVLGSGYAGWSPAGPTLILCGPPGVYREISPTFDQLGATSSAYTELQIPLAGGNGWTAVDTIGFQLSQVTSFELHFDPNCNTCAVSSVTVWIDDAFFY